jgi:hypothetical protein
MTTAAFVSALLCAIIYAIWYVTCACSSFIIMICAIPQKGRARVEGCELVILLLIACIWTVIDNCT